MHKIALFFGKNKLEKLPQR